MNPIAIVTDVMDATSDLLVALVEWIQALGLWAVFLLTFGDSFGLPSSGEFAMLVWAGLREDPLALVILIGFVGAAAGDNAIYWTGRLIGAPLIRRVIKDERRVAATGYIHRHGAKAIIGTRMLAAIRTKVAILAGAAHYPYPRFLLYDAIGCLIWAVSFGIIGRVVGDAVGVTNILDRIGVIAVIGAVLVVILAVAQRLLLPRLVNRRLNRDG